MKASELKVGAVIKMTLVDKECYALVEEKIAFFSPAANNQVEGALVDVFVRKNTEETGKIEEWGK